MSLTFLKQNATSIPMVVLSSAQEAVVESEIAVELGEMTLVRAGIERSQEALDHVLNAIDVSNGLIEQKVSGAVVSAVFGTQIYAAGVPEEVAEEVSVACTESAGDNDDVEQVATEVLQSAKDIVMGIVNWLIDQFKTLRAAAKRMFAKRFGSIKRSLDAWRKVKAKAEQMQEDGYSLEEKSSIEIKGGAAYFVLGKTADLNPRDVVAWKDIPAEIEAIGKVITTLSKGLSDTEVSEASGLADMSMKIKDLVAPHTAKVEGRYKTFDTGAEVNVGVGIALLGRQVMFKSNRIAGTGVSGNNAIVSAATDENLVKIKKFLNGVKVGIRPSNIKLTKLEEVKVKPATLGEIEVLSTAYIDVLTDALALETNKAYSKIEKSFDKAMVNAKKWSKDAETDSAADKRKAISAANMMSAYMNVQMDDTLGKVGDIIEYTSSVSKAHGSVMGSMFKAYKKA